MPSFQATLPGKPDQMSPIRAADPTLPQGTSLVLLRSAPPIITTMRYWLHRPEAETLLAQRAEVEAIMRPGTAGIGEATVTDD